MSKIIKRLTGGTKTDSGHKINMTDDQMTQFMQLRAAAVRDIMTDSAFTGAQKHELIKQMPSMKDFGFYEFLNTQYQSGPVLAEYIKQLVSKNRPRNTRD